MSEFKKYLLAAVALGIYLGMFIGEANAMFQCEKDRTLTITGLFWESGIRYVCSRALAQEPGEQIGGE